MNITEKKLREFINKTIVTIISENKDGAKLSGMSPIKDKNTSIKPDKLDKKSVMKGDTPASVTATSETKPDDTGVEVKKMKNSDDQKPKITDDSFELNIDGIELNVKGKSNAGVSYTYLIGQIKKSLEGKGHYVKKINIELEPRDTIYENIRSIVRSELIKYLFD